MFSITAYTLIFRSFPDNRRGEYFRQGTPRIKRLLTLFFVLRRKPHSVVILGKHTKRYDLGSNISSSLFPAACVLFFFSPSKRKSDFRNKFHHLPLNLWFWTADFLALSDNLVVSWTAEKTQKQGLLQGVHKAKMVNLTTARRRQANRLVTQSNKQSEYTRLHASGGL